MSKFNLCKELIILYADGVNRIKVAEKKPNKVRLFIIRLFDFEITNKVITNIITKSISIIYRGSEPIMLFFFFAEVSFEFECLN